MSRPIFNAVHGIKRVFTWYRRVRAFGGPRKQSDYRATSLAEQLVSSGSLQNSRLTGSPLARGSK